jgi:hypothetical protein
LVNLAALVATTYRAAGRNPDDAISRPSREELQLRFLELRGLLAAALSVVLKREGDSVTLVEHWQSGALDSRRVHKHVLRAVLGGDEAEAFGAVEEFDCSGESHNGTFPIVRERAGNEWAHAQPRQLRIGKGLGR